MILPKKRDPRFITVRRGGTLRDSNHHLLALWAADCAQHVLPLFEAVQPNDDRPRRAIELARAWTRGQVTINDTMLGRYTADAWRSRIYAVRYFLGFATAGGAVPLNRRWVAP